MNQPTIAPEALPTVAIIARLIQISGLSFTNKIKPISGGKGKKIASKKKIPIIGMNFKMF